MILYIDDLGWTQLSSSNLGQYQLISWPCFLMHLWSAVGVARAGWLMVVSTEMAGSTGMAEVSPPATQWVSLGLFICNLKNSKSNKRSV